tara:strand:- start:230 stop:691 length:462 start_codon:yes stop_codon:yes gene_type:complete
MSYIKKIESDYNKNIVSIDEVNQLREKYYSLNETDKLELDRKYKDLNEDLEINSDFSVIDYSNHRNIFWKNRYPVSKGLYTLTKILGWLVIIICTCAFLYVTTQVSSGGLGGIVLAYGVFAGILMLFISETILFQIDKSFFLYLDIHKKLTNL